MKKMGTRRIGKGKYPEKTSLNLLIQERDAVSNPKFQIFLFIVFLIILALFVKFMVVDKISEAYQVQQSYQDMQSEISQLQEENKDYSKIRAQYSHYGNGYLNDEEKATQDRLAMMNLIEKKVMTRADIQALDISGNVASLTIDKIRLKTVSDIVADLEANEAVSFVAVSTAGTTTDSNASVTATFEINFVSLLSEGGEQ